LRSKNENKEEPALESETPEEDPYPESITTKQQNSSPTHEAHPKSEDLTCPNKKCGKIITQPLEMIDLSRGPKANIFYVCPYCMSKLDATTEQEKAPKPSVKKPVEATGTNKTRPKNCPHYLGYLKGRARNTPIPNECLTCPEAIKCLLG
jgi:hypothetical protein